MASGVEFKVFVTEELQYVFLILVLEKMFGECLICLNLVNAFLKLQRYIKPFILSKDNGLCILETKEWFILEGQEWNFKQTYKNFS